MAQMAHREHKILNEPEIQAKAKKYGQLVREKRKALRYTLKQLADLVDCSYQTIHGIENGGCPSFAMREKINCVLNGGVDLLCE